MIAFTKEFLRRTQQKFIPLLKAERTTIYAGCRIEKIDAEIDENNCIRHLVIYTRSPAREIRNSRFFLK